MKFAALNLRSREALPRLAIAVLLLASATTFAIGVAVERSQPHPHDESTAASNQAGATPTPAGSEGSSAREQQERPGGQTTAAETDTHAESEKLFGINTESTPLVAGVVAASIAIALAVVVFPWPLTLLVVAAIGLAAVAFDIREAIHQAQESRHTVLAMAIVTANLHVTMGALAIVAAVLNRVRAQQPL